MELARWEEGALLPLGKGYSRPVHFLDTWESRACNREQPGVSLELSLRWVGPLLPPGYLRRVLEHAPRCLISGCSVKKNPRTLASFLAAHHVPAPTIEIIDLIDLEKIWKPNGSVRYHVADAGNLRELFPDESFDLIVQDHLLNCAPIDEHNGILAEMARIVRRSGLILLNYTDSRNFPAAGPVSNLVEDRVRRGSQQYSFGPGLAEHVGGRACDLVRTPNGHIAVTKPWGNLEHFTTFEDFEARLKKASLAIQHHVGVDAVDANGLLCHRNYCIVNRA
jgi:hypothetical protein